MFVPLLLSWLSAFCAARTVPLVFYQTNDIHGALEPMPLLASVLKSEKSPYLFLDSGDWFQGTPEGNLTRGEAVIDLLNALGLDAAAVGNHDFDYGEENVRRLARQAQFPFLGSNIKRDAALVDYIKPYLLRLRGGATIGIFGLNTSHMSTLVPAEQIAGLEFEREIDAARRTIAELRARGAEVIVAVTHMGIEEHEGVRYEGIDEGDLALAEQAPGIDLILGGHLHVPFKKPLRRGGACITQTGGHLRSVFRVVLSFDDKTRRVRGCEGAPIALSTAAWTPDPAAARLVAAYRERARAEMSAPLGSAAEPLPRDSSAVSPMGRWFSEVLRRWAGTELAFVNTFGIRADLPAGPLSFGDVYKVMPFDNRAVKVEIKGAQLREMIERALSDSALWIQFSGLELEHDPKAPYGSRLRRVTVGGSPLDDEKLYLAATHDFMAKVDKAMKGLEFRITADNGPLVRDLLVEEVKTRSPIAAPPGARLIPAP